MRTSVERLPCRPSHRDLLDVCRTLIAGLTRQDITGKLWIIRRGQIREYQREG